MQPAAATADSGKAASTETPRVGGPVAAGPGSPTAPPAPGAPRPFAEIVKDAKEQIGMFRIFQKDDKIWIEIAPDQFDKPFFFAANLSSGLGEKMFFGGLIGNSYIASFRKVGTQVQLIARNTEYFADAGTPQAIAVAASFSDSLLAAAPIVSQPHPERKSILIEANSLLLADIPGANGALERTYRQGYTFDARNSNVTKTRVTPDLLAFNVNAHYALQRVAQPPPVPGPVPFTQPPATVPDIRSLFLGYNYNFAKLPDEPMHARVADDRVGYFQTTRFDFSNDRTLTPRVYYVDRWRLEKSDPSAPLSEAKQPIVYWLDRNIPEKYRQTIIDGVLEWNKAFERIGIKNALQAKIQPDDVDLDAIDSRHATIRWITSARPAFSGIGLSQVDPRSGEILVADIGIDPVLVRNRRFIRVEQIPLPAANPSMLEHPERICMAADYAEQETNFALDLLDARGDIAPDSPEAEQFILEALKDVAMHEVGHTLGLRHNFRASTVYSQAQLNDPEFTAKYGISGSVMEYNAINIALPGEKQGSYGMKTLGPYDYWAIEYGYKEIEPAHEAEELLAIASRNDEPTLAYATDEDAFFAIDPAANQSDLGNDPLEFARRRFILVRELWDRWEARQLKPGESYVVLRRTVGRGLATMGVSATNLAKYVGGVTTLRDHPGSPRAPLTPIDAARQRQALKLIASGLFAADSFRFKPDFMRNLQVDYLDRNDIYDSGLSTPGVDYSLNTQVLQLQRAVLGQLMSDNVAQRILDSEVKLDNPASGFRLSELYDALHASIWSELKTGGEIPPLRRNLQREHLSRVANALVRPSPTTPADSRALLREDAKLLREQLRVALARPGLSKETKAHLSESLSTLDETLKAPLQRQGV
jgi:hypothetical protein